MVGIVAMKALFFATLLPLIACHSWAEERKKDSLLDKAIGYWMVDFESEATKSLIKTISEDGGEPMNRKELEELVEEIAESNFELTGTKLKVHTIHDIDESDLEIKTEDVENQQMEGMLIDQDSESMPMKITVHDRGITLFVQENPEEELMAFGLTRMDKKTFEERSAELEKRRLARRKPAMLDTPDGYPVATPVPDKEGFVFSPYNKQVVDIRDIPSGTLVQDPTFPAEEKKFFRVP